MRHQRYILLIFFAAAVLTGVTVNAGTVSGFEAFAVPDNALLGGINVTSILGLVSGVIVFGVLLRNQRAIAYIDDVVDELFKVTWPTREETMRAATTVVATTLFVAAVIGVYDLVFQELANLFLFTES